MFPTLSQNFKSVKTLIFSHPAHYPTKEYVVILSFFPRAFFFSLQTSQPNHLSKEKKKKKVRPRKHSFAMTNHTSLQSMTKWKTVKKNKFSCEMEK